MPFRSSAVILASSLSSISSAILPNQGLFPFPCFGLDLGAKSKVADPSGFSVFATPLISEVRGLPLLLGKLTVEAVENGLGVSGFGNGIVPVLICRTI
jgi:hypothetical protein